MSQRLFFLAFLLGLLALGWVASGFVGTSALALAMTALIATAYVVGANELRQFRAATGSLRAALDGLSTPPAALADWLQQVPAGLRDAVRLRIEGHRGALPGPALTPFLVGLLVMLGMLGTFLGMVVTFKGAVSALQGSTDVQAIRAALAEPIKGLSLSFGTSVAGVAASAMLGLMSAIARRERLDVARRLDAEAAGVLQPFSLAQQRQESLRALQAQSRVLPEVAESLHALLERIERRSEQLDAQLLDRQAQLQREVTAAYGELARSVAASLQQNLAASTQATGEAIRPVVQAAMAQLVQEAQGLHARLGEVARSQAESLSTRFEAAEQQRLHAWTAALEQRATQVAERAGGEAQLALEQVRRLLDQSGELVRSRAEAESRWLQEHGERMDQLAATWRSELAALREDESRRGAAAVERLADLQATLAQHLAGLRQDESRRGEQAAQRLGELQATLAQHLSTLRAEESARGETAVQRLSELQGAVTEHLATLGAALEAPLTRLLNTAAEVPQAAAGVISRLREEMSRVAERDNLALQERTVLLERLGALLQSLEQAAGEQRGAIESLVGSASSVLEQAQSRFGQALQAQGAQAAELGSQVAEGAARLAGVAESFGESVQAFQASHDKLAGTLQQVEASLRKSTERSDEQLAYYVAQAREVIDLSIASQQSMVDSLRELKGPPQATTVLADIGTA